jgi:hypothetical protein
MDGAPQVCKETSRPDQGKGVHVRPGVVFAPFLEPPAPSFGVIPSRPEAFTSLIVSYPDLFFAPFCLFFASRTVLWRAVWAAAARRGTAAAGRPSPAGPRAPRTAGVTWPSCSTTSSGTPCATSTTSSSTADCRVGLTTRPLGPPSPLLCLQGLILSREKTCRSQAASLDPCRSRDWAFGSSDVGLCCVGLGAGRPGTSLNLVGTLCLHLQVGLLTRLANNTHLK